MSSIPIKKAKPISEIDFENNFSNAIWHNSKRVTFDKSAMDKIVLLKDIEAERKSRDAREKWVVGELRYFIEELECYTEQIPEMFAEIKGLKGLVEELNK